MAKTTTNINQVESVRFDVDFEGSRGGEISVVFRLESNDRYEDGKLKSLKTTLVAIPKFTKDEESGETSVEMEIKEGRRRLDAYLATIYTRDTVGFERNLDAVEAMKNIFDADPDTKSLLVVDAGTDKYLMRVPQSIVPSLNGKVITKEDGKEESPENEDVQKKSGTNRVKHELKAYETPSNIFRVMFRAVDRAMFRKHLSGQIYDKLSKRLAGSSELSSEIEKKVGVKFKARVLQSAVVYLVYETLEPGSEDARRLLENEDENIKRGIDIVISHAETGSDDKFAQMLTLIDKANQEGKKNGYMKTLTGSMQEEWKSAFNITMKPAEIPVFDPQAGSADGTIRGMDEANFSGVLKGIELRDMSGARERHGSRYDVIDNTNTMLFMDTIKNTFMNGRYHDAATQTFTYLNPPYTNDDEVGKRTVDMIMNGMPVSGLFPVKMKTYLEKNLSSDSLIVDIPRALTGYTDPNTPDRFLFVIGTKYSKDDALKSKAKTLATNDPLELYLPEDATEEMFEKALNNHIEKRSALGMLYYKMYVYHKDSDKRRDMLIDALKERIGEQKEIMANAEKLLEAVNETKKTIEKKMMPIEIAKKQKIFKDTRFYSKEGVYERLSFFEVAQNIPLLIYYRDNVPAVFHLVKEVADELDVSLPVDTETESETFVMGERYDGKKDKVTNLALGMMKLYYYPSKISLEDRDSKETLAMIMEEIKDKAGVSMGSKEKSMLKAAIELASSITIKSKHIIDDDTSMIMPKEVFILQDEYGFDIGELSVELDEFYDLLQEKGLYDINDYVELAVLSKEDKKKILDAFVDDMQFVINTIAEYNGIPKDEVKNDTINIGKAIEFYKRQKKISDEEIHARIFQYATKYKLKEIFDTLTKGDTKALLSQAKSNARIVFDVSTKTANAVGDVYFKHFMQNPIAFYEDHQDEFFKVLYTQLEDLYEDKELLREHLMEYRELMSDIVTPIYQEKVSIATAYSRLAKMLVRHYAVIEAYLSSDNVTLDVYEKLYDGNFRFMQRDTQGLKPHQITEAERYSAMEKDGKKLSLMAHEMRSGKTRTFINTSYYLSLLKNVPMNIIVETSNMPDIFQQVMESFPHLALRARCFIDGKKIDINPDRTFNHLPTLEIVPKPYIIAKSQKKFRGGGKTTERLIKRMGKDIDMLVEKLEERYGDDVEAMMKDILQTHKASPFVKIIKSVCPKNK